MAHGLRQLRACGALAVHRSSVRYRSVRPDDSGKRAATKVVVAERRRFDHRCIHIMLDRHGIVLISRSFAAGNNVKIMLKARKGGGRNRAWGHLVQRRCRWLPTIAGAWTLPTKHGPMAAASALWHSLMTSRRNASPWALTPCRARGLSRSRARSSLDGGARHHCQ